MMSVLAQERLLGAALGSALAGFVVFQERKRIYESISVDRSRFSARNQDETEVYKNLLQEISQRVGSPLPQYTTLRLGLGHQPVVTGKEELGGIIFTGEPAKNRKQAEKNEAMAALSSLKHLVKESESSLEQENSDELEQVTIARTLLNYKSRINLHLPVVAARITHPGCNRLVAPAPMTPPAPDTVDNLPLRMKQQEATPATGEQLARVRSSAPTTFTSHNLLHLQKQGATTPVAPSSQPVVQDISTVKGSSYYNLLEFEVVLLTQTLEQIDT